MGEIGKDDVERLMPTTADAFTMTVIDEVYGERKNARWALMRDILSPSSFSSTVTP